MPRGSDTGVHRNLPNETMSSLALLRAKAYGFLSWTYLQVPEMELVTKALSELSFHTESKGMKALHEFFSQNKHRSPEELHEDLMVEYARLFRGLRHGHGPLPPYESVWRGEGRVMGASTTDVVEMYGEANVELAANIREPPDHIGIELGYLSHLCDAEADAWKTGDVKGAVKCLRMEQQFLRDHIDRWVLNFCQQIAESDRTGFYRGIAIVTKEFLAADSEEVREELRKSDQRPS